MPLGSPGFDCPIAQNSRDKVEPLSLKIPLLFLSLSRLVFLSLPFPSKLVWSRLRSREKSSQCHMSNSKWLMGLHPILYPSTLGFSRHGIMPCVHMGPTLELKLTQSAPDTWHNVCHSKCVKCPTLHSLPRKTCKF